LSAAVSVPGSAGWGKAWRLMDLNHSEQCAALWTAAQPTVTAFVRTLMPDFQQAEEVLQRVAVMLVRKFSEYDPQRPFAAWAIGFAKNEVLYYRRQRAHDKHLFNDELVEKIAVTYEQLVEEVDPIHEALGQCVEELQGRSRRVIELRYSRGLNSGEIAGKMKLSSGAVRVLLHRVRGALRECIERRVGGFNGGNAN
jgi:RNA polymerase sigma-70 factor, ECF subfamily